MINYEVMFIIDPTLEEEQKNNVIERVKTVIEEDGKVNNVNVWGLKKLAYPINKKNEGFYVVVDFEATTQLPKELDRRLRISDFVMRHIIINKDAR